MTETAPTDAATEVAPTGAAAPVESAQPPQPDATVPVEAPRPEAAGRRSAAPVDTAEVGQRLKTAFPALFTGQVKPLKLRIQNDIQQRAPGAYSRQALSAFFRRHTASTSYLIAVSKAPHRFDLDGQPAGEIADEHRAAALEELTRRRANRESREQELEQQRRNRATLLRDFERTTLTRANFCALKGVPEGELDGLLEIARQEAAERPRFAPPSSSPSGHRREGPDRGLPERSGRPPRRR